MRCQANSDVLAVVVHAFYIDVFFKIIRSLKGLNLPIKIYVTTMCEHENEVNQILISSGFDFYLLPVVNRGRDVFPFLTVMTEVIQNGHEVVLKLHTKKTKHRDDGDVWMNDILSKLVTRSKVERYFNLIKGDEKIGMIAPAGHIVGMAAYCGSNKNNILRVSKKLGFGESEVMDQVFVAGTMFYAHVAALEPMMDLGYTAEDFEDEDGQIDGTMAHAIERCFSISCLSANLKLISSDSVDGVDLPGVSGKYAFAGDPRSAKHDSIYCTLSEIFIRFKRFVVKFKNMM